MLSTDAGSDGASADDDEADFVTDAGGVSEDECDEECERAERDLSDLRDQTAAQSTALIKATDTAQADRASRDAMLEAAQAHLDFAARTRKEAEEAAARDAKALAEKRALEDAERDAREARLVGDLEAKIRDLEETRRSKEAEFDAARRVARDKADNLQQRADAEEARLRAASSQADVAASRLAAIEARCAELDTRSMPVWKYPRHRADAVYKRASEI